jgi:putative PIN family toxin of toxin-antitoxin system
MGLSAPVRAVLDTNVLVSALLYEAGEMAWLPEALRARNVIPLASEAVIAEHTRILLQLGRKKFQLESDAIHTILQSYLSFAEMVNDMQSIEVRLPQCKDRDDQKFLELACRGKADVLVTSDNALLGLARKAPFAILNPVKFRMRVSELSGDTALRGG